jgi:hypothetical protein
MEERLGLRVLAIPLELPAWPSYMIWHERPGAKTLPISGCAGSSRRRLVAIAQGKVRTPGRASFPRQDECARPGVRAGGSRVIPPAMHKKEAR